MPPPPRPAVLAAQATPLRPKRVHPPKQQSATAQVSPSKRRSFTTRHQLILWMDVAGVRTTDIALKLGMHPNSVSAIKSSPLYIVHRDQLLEQLKGLSFENVLDLIQHDAVRNVEFAISVRNDTMEDTKNRIAAARMMQKEVDRVYPRMTNSKHTEERIVKIEIGGEQMRRIAGALREIGATVADEDIIEPEFEIPSDIIEAKSIDEMRTDLLNAAAESE